ncbi:50S ribosomal protein L15e [Candidatus Marsarchaeota archaeon]|nr:50S ribosomal protein L15e [Candidatus Marsarchaeota archaeon]MCL5404861.1 50S ribosomal protein L15e [Candidatus Marsarchaeota archaeon]
MGANKYIRETIINDYKNRGDVYKKKLAAWSKDPAITRVERPSNLPRARALGYKAKEGIIIARTGVRKGTRKRQTAGGGRKPSKSGRFFSRHKSVQLIAEERVAKKFTNYEVVNSYFVGETGTKRYYEVILASKDSPALKNDSAYKNIIRSPRRAERALTASGRRMRGLH